MKVTVLGLIAVLAGGQALTIANAADMQVAAVTGGKLAIQSKPIPEPAANEVRIKVRAAGVNPVDYGRFGTREGAVPGFDASGVIDAVAPGVTAWKKGDEVIVMAPVGSYAQYVIAPLERVAKKPTTISFEEAAGIPVVGETAYRALHEVARLQKGQRILIHGGAGGVGSAAVQIAKAQGAYVIATASPRNHEFLRSIGANEVIDYNTIKFEEKVKGVDVVLNTADLDTGTRSLTPGVIKPDGILVTVVQPTTAEQCAAAKMRCGRPDRTTGPSVTDLLTKVGALVDGGKYKINVDQTFTLANAQQAWDLGRQKHTRGKLVIKVE
jgi:NADPH:quinone reductase-like Zn-dependent oxidoreductase